MNIIIHNPKKKVLPVIFFVIFSFLAASPANAHRLTVFAWAEGDTVFVESKFAGGRKVKQGEVTVYDTQKKQLVNGKTNDQGEFSFKIPEKTELLIVVSAGMGHQGEWTVSLEELGEIAETAGTSVIAEPSEKKSEPAPVPATTPDISSEAIQSAVEKALDKKLKPVIKMLVKSQDRKPSFTDIFGGIGYIFGLMGIAAYFNYTRKKD
ncbi:MAG: hypothetical protein GY749_05355 [Desulfobacteraceae bacterium]|nr:hypothetical protein [Desulfobacteraceae bacterium]